MEEETENVEWSSRNPPKPPVKLNEVEVRSTELVYITSTNYEEGTFFAQQCKYTNQDLVGHNKKVHQFCKRKAETALTTLLKKVEVGEMICARYSVDGNWYRAAVVSCDDTTRRCRCSFVDYGNIEDVSYDDVLQVDAESLPTIQRAPFGFFCTMKGSETMDEIKRKHLLNCILNEYVLIRNQGQVKDNLWCVELPRVAYNTTFWISFQSGRSRNKDHATKSMQSSEGPQLASTANCA